MAKLLVHANQLYSCQGFRLKDGRKVDDDDMGMISDGAMVYEGKKILWLGKSSQVPAEYRKLESIDLEGKSCITPGWVDCHTHMVFAGDRSAEFARRCAGVPYEQIAKEGGGILSTMRATRTASSEELYQLARERVEESLSFGVKAIEIKSGYGLDLRSELNSLRVIRRLEQDFPAISFQSTFLGAHAIPPEMDRAAYINQVSGPMLDAVLREKLADACDIFVDEGFFEREDARQLLSKAKKMGLKIKLHGDELCNTESAALACELDALSVDHLLKVSDDGIRALAEARNTVAVLLPGTAYFLKADYAPARKLLDAGACVAISTDFNPGSCPCNNLSVIMNMSALYMQMTRAEILAAVTYNAAKALGMHQQQGTLEAGREGSFTIVPFKSFEECFYRLAWAPAALWAVSPKDRR